MARETSGKDSVTYFNKNKLYVFYRGDGSQMYDFDTKEWTTVPSPQSLVSKNQSVFLPLLDI